MPYSQQHLTKKARLAKRNIRTGCICPCKICKSNCKQSETVVKRHLEAFGRHTETEFIESESDESIALELDFASHEGIGNDLTESSEANEADLYTHIVEGKRRRTESASTCSSEGTDGDCEVDQIVVDNDNKDHSLTTSVSSVTESSSSSTENSSSSIIENNDSCSSSSDDQDSDASLNESTEEIDDDIYSSEKAKLPLFENSDFTVLQALAGYFQWFTEHPSTSKSALSSLLQLKKLLLPQPNNLPGTYHEAYNFLKPFLLPFETYHACPNDCVLFRKTTRYDYSKLAMCPVCGSNRYYSCKKAKRKFVYYPLGPRWRRMYGNATISEVLQSHDHKEMAHKNVMRDIHDSPAWKQAFSESGFSDGDPRGMLLQLSTDGVNPFSCNKVCYSMWPIMLSMLNLPRSVRNLFGNVMLAGIIPAQANDQEPKHLDPYLEVVVDEILDLSGATFFDEFRRTSFAFKVSLLNYVLDYPGLGKVFTAAGAAALQGCMWCEIRGKLHCTYQPSEIIPSPRATPGHLIATKAQVGKGGGI